MRAPGPRTVGWVALVALLLALPAVGSPASATPSTARPTTLLILPNGPSSVPIDHIVVLLMENHAYDNYFATYCLNTGAYCSSNASGVPPGTCVPLLPSDPSKGCVTPYLYPKANVTKPTDMPHLWDASRQAYDGGLMDGFYAAEAKKLSAFGYYDGSLLPTYWDIAEQYGLGDNFFASALSYSLPNHWFIMAGQAPAIAMNSTLGHPAPNVLSDDEEEYLDASNATRSIADVLVNSSVSWRYYDWPTSMTNYGSAIHGTASAAVPGSAFDFWNPLAAKAESYSSAMASHFVANSQFFTDARAGLLPNVSWVVPPFNQSDHAPANLQNGEGYVANVVNAVESSSAWGRSAIFVTWDDYGGYYDHVPPPAVDANGLSFRAPLLVIGPYVRENYVDHHFGYFESLLRLIEWRWNLTSITERDAEAPLLLEYFDFNASPRAPITIPGPTTAVYPYPFQPLAPPPSPQNLSASSGPGTVTLNWSVASGGTAIGAYLLRYGTAQAPTQFSTRVDGSATTVTVPNLLGGQLYQFALTSLTANRSSATASAAAVAATSPYYNGGGMATPPIWTALPNRGASAPSARQGAAFAADAKDNVDLLFGGLSASGAYLADTWEWAGGQWFLLNTTAPPGRAFAAMAYDPAGKGVILYGGTTAQGYRGDTWKFSGGVWSNITAAAGTAPTRRAYTTLVTDVKDNYLVLFGGKSPNGALADTWKLANGRWAKLTTSPAPIARWGASAGYDYGGQQVVLFGGATAPSKPLNDTWSFSAGSWRTLSVGLAPAGRYGASATYDVRDGYLLLLGGYGASGYAAGSWQFSAGAWHPMPTGWAPPTRAYASMTYDALHQVVLYGLGLNGSSYGSDLWACVAPLSVTATASPTYARAPALVAFAPTTVGGIVPYTYAWDFADGSKGSTLAFASHAFSVPGPYWVNLTVRDYVGGRTSISVPVQIVGPLAAEILLAETPTNATVGLTANVGGGWAPYTFGWAFGDGGTSSSSPPLQHGYAAGGDYTVTLRVVDASGAFVTASLVVSVPSENLWAAVAANATSGIAPLSVALNATAGNGSAPYAFDWDFGDGTPGAEGAAVNHTYVAPGNYTAIVTVTDESGETASASLVIAAASPLSVDALTGQTVASGAEAFAAPFSGGQAPFLSSWTFGDGSTSSVPNPTHEFTHPGTYAVSLLVADSSGQFARSSTVVTVASAPLDEAGSIAFVGTEGAALPVALLPEATLAAPPGASGWAARWVGPDGELEREGASRRLEGTQAPDRAPATACSG